MNDRQTPAWQEMAKAALWERVMREHPGTLEQALRAAEGAVLTMEFVLGSPHKEVRLESIIASTQKSSEGLSVSSSDLFRALRDSNGNQSIDPGAAELLGCLGLATCTKQPDGTVRATRTATGNAAFSDISGSRIPRRWDHTPLPELSARMATDCGLEILELAQHSKGESCSPSCSDIESLWCVLVGMNLAVCQKPRCGLDPGTYCLSETGKRLLLGEDGFVRKLERVDQAILGNTRAGTTVVDFPELRRAIMLREAYERRGTAIREAARSLRGIPLGEGRSLSLYERQGMADMLENSLTEDIPE
jgi:hypothetical protein